ncbi:MAG: hypothetical protein HQ515_01880, partial [Phycisphaeraceae bacterium]|nr:hypothetical protein [Phycisphaeraceae bacterium]
MNHEQAEKLLGALIFDDLDEVSKARLLATLETDADLRESLADLRMALKVTADAVQNGPSPVLSDTRLAQLEKLSRSKGHPKAILIARWAAVAACLAIVAGAFLGARLNRASLSSLAVTESGSEHNAQLTDDSSLAYQRDSLGLSPSARGSGRSAVTDREDQSDQLLLGGVQVADSTWDMKEAASQPFARGLEVARPSETKGLLKAKSKLEDELGSFGNHSATNNDMFYAYSDPAPPAQSTHEALSWNRADGNRGEVLHERLLPGVAGTSNGLSVDLYAMDDFKRRPESDGQRAVVFGESGDVLALSGPSMPSSARAYDIQALGQLQAQESLLRGGTLSGEAHDGLSAISPLSDAPAAARPAEPALTVRKDFEGAVAWNERLPSKPARAAEGSTSRYGRHLMRVESADRLSPSQGVPLDRPEVSLAEKEPESASRKRLRGLISQSGFATEGWRAGRNPLGEELSWGSLATAKTPDQGVRTDLKLDVHGASKFSETDVAGSRHGLGLEAKVAEKVSTPANQPLGGGGYGGRMMGGSMGGSMGGGMMGGMQSGRPGFGRDSSGPGAEQAYRAADLAEGVDTDVDRLAEATSDRAEFLLDGRSAGKPTNLSQRSQAEFQRELREGIVRKRRESDSGVTNRDGEVALQPQTQRSLALLENDAMQTRFGTPVEPAPGTKTPLLGDVPPVVGLFRQGHEAAGTRGGIAPSSKPVQPQKVLVQSKIIHVDESALQDLGFQIERSSPQADVAVWSWKENKTGLDSVIDELKQKEQLKVIATPSTMTQHGKEAQ